MVVETSPILLEQYKLYVELMDRVSQRRENTNKFYITILTVLLALNVAETNLITDPLLPTILGLVLSTVWFTHIRSFRLLNREKFKVIHEIEQQLPIACFKKEMDNLEQSKYWLVSKIEQVVPICMGLLFLGILFKNYLL